MCPLLEKRKDINNINNGYVISNYTVRFENLGTYINHIGLDVPRNLIQPKNLTKYNTITLQIPPKYHSTLAKEKSSAFSQTDLGQPKETPLLTNTDVLML